MSKINKAISPTNKNRNRKKFQDSELRSSMFAYAWLQRNYWQFFINTIIIVFQPTVKLSSTNLIA